MRLAFLNYLRTAVKRRQKHTIALNFYADQNLQRVMYVWKKIANQSKLDKDHKLRDLRNDKMFGL